MLTLMIVDKMTNIFGYLRLEGDTSSVKAQIERLEAAGAIRVVREASGPQSNGKTRLAQLLTTITKGDTLMVENLYSLAKNTKQLLDLVEQIQQAGGSLKVLDSDLDTATLPEDVFLKLLRSVDEFGKQVKRERQAIGIAKAKREGRYKGRKPTARAKADEVLELIAQGLTRKKVADQLGIGVASVYRILKNRADSQGKAAAPKKPVAPLDVKTKKNLKKSVRSANSSQLSLF